MAERKCGACGKKFNSAMSLIRHIKSDCKLAQLGEKAVDENTNIKSEYATEEHILKEKK